MRHLLIMSQPLWIRNKPEFPNGYEATLPLYSPWGLSARSPGFLDLDATEGLLQHKLPRVVVDDEDTVLLVGPLVPFEHRHGGCGALGLSMIHNLSLIYHVIHFIVAHY